AFLFYRRDLMFKEYIAEDLYKILKQDLEYEEIVEILEVPANEDFGDFSFPTFTLAKLFRKSPKDIAEDIKGEFQSELGVKTEVINGFVNFHIDKLKGSSLAVNEIGRDGYGKTQHLHGQKLVMDFSSPNIAKPFSWGICAQRYSEIPYRKYLGRMVRKSQASITSETGAHSLESLSLPI